MKNVIEASMAMEGGEYLSLPVISQFIEVADPGQANHLNLDDEGDYNLALARFETDYLLRLLKKYNGNIDAAAREAGMNMATIYRKIKKYNIRKEDYQ